MDANEKQALKEVLTDLLADLLDQRAHLFALAAYAGRGSTRAIAEDAKKAAIAQHRPAYQAILEKVNAL